MSRRKIKKPKYRGCNGRPQLWFSVGRNWRRNNDRLRVIFPSGRVEYFMDIRRDDEIGHSGSLKAVEQWWSLGCTSRPTQKQAVKAARGYSYNESFEFLGYL